MFQDIPEDEKLTINSLKFKAYLEDSDVSYEMKDQQLPFAPTSFVNDSMMLRVMQKVKFTFNVFSETHIECVTNFNNLQELLKKIRPSYNYVNDQLAPVVTNVTGYVTINFKGLPERDEFNVHLNSFSYSINKEMGYVKTTIDNNNNNNNNNIKLIPVAYKISLEGKVLLEFSETANVKGNKTAAEGTLNVSGLAKSLGVNVKTNPSYMPYLESIVRGVTGKNYLAFEAPIDALKLAKDLKDGYLSDINGNYTPYDKLTTDQKSINTIEPDEVKRKTKFQKLQEELKKLK